MKLHGDNGSMAFYLDFPFHSLRFLRSVAFIGKEETEPPP